MVRPSLVRILGCLGLALAMMARWLAAPLQALPGYANVDLWDTVMLRGVVAAALGEPSALPTSDAVFFPVGYPALQLTPNLLDHLSAAPLVALLPFPLADSLWWLLVLTLNGLAAHRLGRALGQGEGAGWLAAVAFVLSEPVAREANLHHAPQAMVFWGPWFVVALLELRQRPSTRAAVAAGALLALGGLSYWYFALFLGLGCLPLLAGLPARTLAVLGATTAAISLPALAPFLLSWGEIPLTAGAEAPPALALPEALAPLGAKQAFVAWHGNDPLFPLRRGPMDTTNRVSLSLVVAAALGLRRGPRLPWLWMVGLGTVMVLGPVLQWRGTLPEVAGAPVRLPFAWLAGLHPFLERLTWPERWGILVALGLAAAAARAPRPGLWALLVAAEGFLVSQNLPLQVTDLRHRACQAELAAPLAARASAGAVLELPLRRPGLQAQRPGVHRRFHRRDVVNPILLPPGATPPPDWLAWQEAQPLIAAIQELEAGRWPQDPGAQAVQALRQAGVAVIVLDADPGAVQTRGGLNRHQEGLSRLLGPPIDLGCALAWWLDPAAPPPAGLADGEAWRERARAWKERHPPATLDTLISPAQDRGGW
ncbi:hypothetical protein L6R53_29760 [Myxococcota bacterium]|nr:hypothetical protein [Myxococcota bacterium]